MKYKVELTAFEGPMDLLLHLIHEAKIDIYDIPINEITEQFLNYIKKMKELNLDIASEFIVMASTLIEIKSKLLLPKKVSEDKDDEEVDPREELVNRLIEYQKYKSVSEELKDLEKKELKIYYKPKEEIFYEEEEIVLDDLSIDILLKAVNNILKEKNKEEQIITINEIQREEYTLDKCILELKELLDIDKKILFSSILDENSSREKIITYFLSILELTKSKYIKIEQDENFSDLLISRRGDDIDE